MPKDVIIVAGPNGSGKTTFATQYIEIYGYHYLSADAIAAQLAPHCKVQDYKVQAGRAFF